MSSNRFADKVIIVTGGGMRLGEDYCKAFAREGGKVVCADINLEAAAQTIEDIRKAGGTATAIECDVTKADEVDNMVKEAIHTHGHVDVLVNNAGIIRRRSLVGTTEEDWDEQVGVDLKGPFLCARAVAFHMMERGYGKIVNISSIAAIVGCTSSAYSASKAGLNGLTRQWALELASHGIRVNTVAPGYTATPINTELRQTPAGKRMGEAIPLGWGKPAEITAAVLFLCAQESDYITGQTLAVDGGVSTTVDMGAEYRTFDK